MTLSVDFVIAVHDPRRPVLRALDSVLASGRDDVRVTVVCHGITPEDVPGLRERERELVRLVSFSDGIPSPAGPFNHGLDLATADFVGVMGSDDWLAPGALDAWVAQAEAGSLDVLFGGIEHQNGVPLRNPQVRPWRRNRLDPVRDRLFQRAAPLGLIRREAIETPRIRFSEGLATGEDIAFTAALVGAVERIGVGFSSPRYVIGADATDRVTSTSHSFRTLLSPVTEILGSEWFRDGSRAIQTAAVTARLRGSILPYAMLRRTTDSWPNEDLIAVHEVVARVANDYPDALRPFARSERWVFTALADPEVTPATATAAVTASASAKLWNRLVPERLVDALHRESTLVRYAGYVIARLGA